ncbi:hypothetical protein [Catenulispora subtropica]|uniref:Glycosyltransferase RgtA/B/C/D-like domain-containing protein n=1 Tax=Catenulispora subtropica TaxID=450798 RepID=A0ABN2SYY6_9ACTN
MQLIHPGEAESGTESASEGPLTARLTDRVGGRATWAAAFGLNLVLLLAHNLKVFSKPIAENADFAANSLATIEAKHFTLLFGNYSRQGFRHPGPADFYVQAAGEWLFRDVLHLVPAPWNGQLLAILTLNAALLAGVAAIFRSWLPSWAATLLGAAVALLFIVQHSALIDSPWMPYIYFPGFLLFITAAASIAAGRRRHLPAFAIGAGLCVHGHVCFMLFVGALGALALWQYWRHREPAAHADRSLLIAWAIAALFALPIVLDTLLHWPGQFGQYLTYSGSDRAGGHGVRETLSFAFQYWPGGAVWPVVTVALVLAAAAAARFHPDPAVRPFLARCVAAAVGTGALMVVYTAFGVDSLGVDDSYTGYFCYSAPLMLLVVIAVTAADLAASRLPARAGWAVPGAALACGLFALTFSWEGQQRGQTGGEGYGAAYRGDPSLPKAAASLISQAGDKPVVLTFPHDAWPRAVGLLVAVEHQGHTACVADKWWTFMMTEDFICSDRQAADGFQAEVPLTPMP